MPVGPTEFVRPPWVESVQHLDSDLVHMRARATIAPGREWLAQSFLPDVLKERAAARPDRARPRDPRLRRARAPALRADDLARDPREAGLASLIELRSGR